jgi:LexA DNA binding domain
MSSTGNDEPRGRRRQPPPRLTRAELSVLAALDDLLSELGRTPTHRELLERLNWSPKSKGSLNQYLGRLQRKGVIAGTARSLRVVE